MPGPMLHILVAKKYNPTAVIDFYIGNLAPDAHGDANIKSITHLRNVPDREIALKEYALNAHNEYLKGTSLHLFVDWRWEKTLYSAFIEKEDEGWNAKYNEEIRKMGSYAFHNTDWACGLWERMVLCDEYDFVETEYITKEDVKLLVYNQHKWQRENKLASSSSFPPTLVNKFVYDTADDYNKWFT